MIFTLTYEEALLKAIRLLSEIDNYVSEIKIYPYFDKLYQRNGWMVEWENNSNYAEREV